MWLKLRAKFEWRLKRTLQSQLQFGYNQDIGQFDRRSKKILMPQIETQHYQYYQMLILAKALQLRGAEVKILLCGSRLDSCEIKSIRNKAKDPCLNCRFSHRNIVPLYGLDVFQLSDFISNAEVESLSKEASILVENYPSEYFFKGINIVPMTNDSVTRYYYGAIPSDSGQVKTIRKQHLTSSMIGIEVAERIDKTFSPDVILSNMYTYSAWEPYYRYYGQQDRADIFAVSLSNFDYHAVILNIMELFLSPERYLRFIKYRGHHKLRDQEKAILQKFIDSRFKGENLMFQEQDYFAPNKYFQEHIPIDKTKRNIFLFSNVYWDVGLSDRGGLFGNVINWVLQTIEILKDRDDCHLYVKTHPAEKYGSLSSLKGVEEFIRERFSLLPNNITIIPPELKIKPYDLFPFIDLGVVFNGTIGLEMLLDNVPVVITGNAHYGRLGLAYEPHTLKEYKKILVGEVPPIFPDKDEVEVFAYFYFIKTLIPWKLTERAYADNFKGYTFNSLDDIMPGKDKYLDHICNCILDSENTIVEGWE
jgi:hypothetical protein